MKKIFVLTLVFSLIIPALLAGGCREARYNKPENLLFPPKQLQVDNSAELEQRFKQLDYGWKTLDLGVPSFTLVALPEDLDLLSSTKQKKRLFFLSLLPMALMINEEIALQRHSLLTITDRLNAGETLTVAEKAELLRLASSYDLDADPLTDRNARQELLKRVDGIPESLLLAQAANESAYGTSRFAKLANNLFGEWTFTPGTGLVPDDRPEGASYEVRLFPNIMASLRSYVRNLNTHWAYTELRELRQQLRQQNLPVTGMQLAAGLELYSERRFDYVEEIRNIIRFNRLNRVLDLPLRNDLPQRQYRQPKPALLAMAEH